VGTNRSKRSPAPSGEDPRQHPRPKPDGSRGDGHAAPAALGRFGADIQAAFAEAAARQRASLSGAGEHLEDLSRQSFGAVEPESVGRLKAEITKCVAEAAAETVTIWMELTKQVQAECLRLDQAVESGLPSGPDSGGTNAAAGRRARR